MAAWWRERVVAPVRRAWLAVARRARKTGSTGVVDLHRDVQTCGYDDVQVMWNMLSWERQTFSFRPAPEKRRRASFWRPSFGTSDRRIVRRDEQRSTGRLGFEL